MTRNQVYWQQYRGFESLSLRHFATGCHFRSGSCSILLVIERYTDKHRVVLIVR